MIRLRWPRVSPSADFCGTVVCWGILLGLILLAAVHL